jgi:hypothetical protein
MFLREAGLVKKEESGIFSQTHFALQETEQ